MAEKIQSKLFNRPPRIQDNFGDYEITIPPPPAPAQMENRDIFIQLLPMGGVVLMGLLYVMIYSGNSGGRGILFAIPMLGLGLFGIASSFILYGYQRYLHEKKDTEKRRDYHRILDRKLARLHAGRLLQLLLLNKHHPPAEEIQERILNRNIELWERRPEDLDYLTFRIGRGERTSLVRIQPPDPDLEIEGVRRAYGLFSEFRLIPDAPIVADFKAANLLGIVGQRENCFQLVNSFLTQFAALHSPEDTDLYVFAPGQWEKSWRWVRWLPHCSMVNIGGQPDMIAYGEDRRRLLADLSRRLDQRKQAMVEQQLKADNAIFVIIDEFADIENEPGFSILLEEGKNLGIYAIFLASSKEGVPSKCNALLELKDEHAFEYAVVGENGEKSKGIYERIGPADAERCARSLISTEPRIYGRSRAIPKNLNLLQTYSTASPEEIDLKSLWSRLPDKDGVLPFPAPIGNQSETSTLSLNLSEFGDGPHGIIAGTTGSGKSELLQTLIASLAIQNHPYYLNFLLIDFKGGSTIDVFRNLPHTVGTVSNLDKSTALRTLEAIKAEILRRQYFLAEFEDVEDINDYHKAIFKQGGIPKGWVPLPHLAIIVDEFAQLAQEIPDFLPELVATARLGRSLGVHLILATQRPGNAISDDMRSNLNFRICLRVQTIDESRDLLRRPDAAYIPNEFPGRAFFQLGDTGTPSLFQTARVGVSIDSDQSDEDDVEVIVELVEGGKTTPVFRDVPKKLEQEQQNLSQILVQRVGKSFEAMAQERDQLVPEKILLPQLPPDIPLLELAGIGKSTNLKSKIWKRKVSEGLRFPVGKIDDLGNRRQPPFEINFQHKGGHVFLVGGQGSGKTAFLETVILSGSLHYSPEDLTFYVASFAGLGLDYLRQLPHVGDVFQGHDLSKLEGLLDKLEFELEQRKKAFQTLPNIFEYRRTNSDFPVLCTVIDNFSELKDPIYYDYLQRLQKVIRDGRAYGLFFVITSYNPNDIPYNVSTLIENRIALYLPDPVEYVYFVGRPRYTVTEMVPGRGVIKGNPPDVLQIAYVANESGSVNDGPGKTKERIINELVKNWTGDYYRPLEIGVLKHYLAISEVIREVSFDKKRLVTLVGQVRREGGEVGHLLVDWQQDSPHYLVVGSPRSGKSNLLRMLVTQMALQKSPQEVAFVLVDSTQKGLVALKDLPHVIDWVTEEKGFVKNIYSLLTELQYREQQLHADAFAACQIVFVIDDYDTSVSGWNVDARYLVEVSKRIHFDSSQGFHLLISRSADARGEDAVEKRLKMVRSGFALGDEESATMFGRKASTGAGPGIAGRGFSVIDGRIIATQFCDCDEPFVESVLKKWKNADRSKWAKRGTDPNIQDLPIYAEPTGPVNGGLLTGNIDEMVKGYLSQPGKQKR